MVHNSRVRDELRKFHLTILKFVDPTLKSLENHFWVTS